MTSRRSFLACLLAAGTVPRLGWADVGSPALLAAARDGAGQHWLHGLSASGESRFRQPLPGRGHAAAAHPTRPEAVAFARRPGTFAIVLDCVSGAALARLTPPEGRQFNGHGAFSADGARLFTSEVLAEGSRGRIGIWETGSYRRIGEWDSGGIGPHEVLRLPGDLLAVANGGIVTDPQDRSKLNLESMRPNLTLLAGDGTIHGQAELMPELAQLSIRHLALAPDGELAFAMQWEGDPSEAVPLLGLHRPGGATRLLPEDPFAAQGLRGYAGSVAFSGDGGMVAITSPVGGAVLVCDRVGQVLALHQRADICGLAPAMAGFLATDGGGVVWHLDAGGMRMLARGALAWDNHLVPLG